MGQAAPQSTCVQAHTKTHFPDAALVRPVGVLSQIDQIEINLSAYSHLPRLMTPKLVQQESRLSKGTINKAIQSGRLRSIKPTPRSRRIPVEYFAEWIAAMKADAAAVDAQADA